MKQTIVAYGGITLLLTAAACTSGPPATALANRTFYQYDEGRGATNAAVVERRWPALDRKDQGPDRDYIGVAILGGSMLLSRPAGWTVRRASLTSERRFLEYVSPHGYLVAVYETTDSPTDAWRDVLGRYEGDAPREGLEIIGRRIPVAVGNAQGREYVVRRTVPGQRAPYLNTSREIVFRSDQRVDVLEIVTEDVAFADVAKELAPVLDSLMLL